MGKKFLTVDQQEEIGILSPEVRARMAAAYASGAPEPPELGARRRPGQTALFNAHEDAIECSRCGGRMVRAGTCYTCRDSHMRFEPSGMTNDPDIRAAKSIVDYVFRWMGKKFLTVEQQEEVGILSPEVRARMAQSYAAAADAAAAPIEQATPGQTALFNSWEDAVECSRCGGRMVRAGTCYTCRDCGTSTGCG